MANCVAFDEVLIRATGLRPKIRGNLIQRTWLAQSESPVYDKHQYSSRFKRTRGIYVERVCSVGTACAKGLQEDGGD